MPVSGAVERRRRKDALRNDMRDQRNRNRMNREEAMRDRRANYQTNRLNAADAIGSDYGPATRSAYLQGRHRGGAAGQQAAGATAQGMRTANYVGQQNTFANDAANRYGVIRTADANYLTGEGNRMAGYGAMIDPTERTKQAQIAGDTQLGVADRQLAGVFDANYTSRFGSSVGGLAAQHQTDVSAEVARDQIASQERLASLPVARDITPLGEGTAYFDPRLGRVVGEDEQAFRQGQRIEQSRSIDELESLDGPASADILDKLTADYIQNNEGATADEAEAYFASGGGRAQYAAALEAALGSRREFALGDANPGNKSFWTNPANLIPGNLTRKFYGRLFSGE